ncbi:hypothetical protein [Streptomyces mirabilis]|nr:hypothetical protein [Streptomyces mirabilis]MCX4429645.1 hypothetical protein [Streptomyces mirabilis]
MKRSATPLLPDDAVSDTRTYYDLFTTLGAAPTTGETTMQRKASLQWWRR